MPPQKGQGSVWSSEMDAALTDLIAKNVSLSRAAASINEQFGTRFTRNAAIGRSHRLGIGKGGPRKAPVRIKPATPRARHRHTASIPMMIPEPAPIVCTEIIPLNIGLMELNDSVCRYPYGEGPFTFCGHPTSLLSPYCAAHHSICNEGKPPLRRAGARKPGPKQSVRSFNDLEVA